MSASDDRDDTDDDGSLSDESMDDLIADLHIKDNQNDSTNNNNNNQENDEPDKKSKKKEKTKRMSWLVQGQKVLVSKASGSALGQSFFKQFVDKETVDLLDIIKELIARDSVNGMDLLILGTGDKVATKTHKIIIKLAVKIILLHEKKILSQESFSGLEFNFRRICSTVKNSFQRSGTMDEATCKRVEQHIRAFETGIREVLVNCKGMKMVSNSTDVGTSTLKRLENIANLVSRPEFLLKTAKSPQFPKIVYIFAYYLEELNQE